MDTDAFKQLAKVDAHVHLHDWSDAFIRQAESDGFRLVAIAVGGESVDYIEEQLGYLWHHQEKDAGRFGIVTTFELERREEDGWRDRVMERLDADFDRGAMAVKVWKDIGMVLRDPDGRFLRIDDERFDPILDHIAAAGKTLAAHMGEPRSCWMPIPEDASPNSYYQMHPEYHMYLHPGHPSYETHIEARDAMLGKHPDLRVVGCHIGSMEHDVAMAAERLQRYPNFAVDISARVGSLQHQDSSAVRDWFMAYPDRILYGTDRSMRPGVDPEEFARAMHDTWIADWNYLSTDNEIPSPRRSEEGVRIKGLALPMDVLVKVYGENAQNWYPELPRG